MALMSSSRLEMNDFAVSGVLKGYDQLLNVVLDETVEYLRGEET